MPIFVSFCTYSRSRLFLFILPYIFIFAYQFQQPGGGRVLGLSLLQRCLRIGIFIVHGSRNTKLSINVDMCVCLRVTALLLSSDKHVCTDDFIPENNIIFFTTTTTSTTTTSTDDNVISM